MIDRIDHIVFNVSSIEKAKEFYELKRSIFIQQIQLQYQKQKKHILVVLTFALYLLGVFLK